MSATIDRASRGTQDAPSPMPRDGTLPSSPAQDAFARLSAMFPAVPLAAIPTAFRFRGGLDVEALRGAMADLHRRHDALRTTLADEGGRIVQRVLPAEASAPLAAEAVSRLPMPSVRERRTAAAVEAAIRAPLDPFGPSLVRWRLFRVSRDDHVLLAVLHHAIADGLSMLVLRRDLATLYRARAEGVAAELPPVTVQYPDIAAWQREQVDGGGFAKEIAYWQERLADAPAPLELPADRPRLALPDWAGRQIVRAVPPPLALAIRQLARERRASLFMVLLAAFKALARAETGLDDLVVRVPMANRPRPAHWQAVGCFMNPLPVRTSLAGDPTFGETLQRVRASAMGALAHQQAPFEAVMASLRAAGQRRFGSSFPVLLQVREQGGQPDPAGAGTRIERYPVDTGVSLYELSIEFEDEAPDMLRASITYRPSLFDAARIAALWDRYVALLDRIAREPDRPLSHLAGTTPPG